MAFSTNNSRAYVEAKWRRQNVLKPHTKMRLDLSMLFVPFEMMRYTREHTRIKQIKIVNCAFVTSKLRRLSRKCTASIQIEYVMNAFVIHIHILSLLCAAWLYVDLKPNLSLSIFMYLCVSTICFRFYSLSYISISLNLHCLVDEKCRDREQKKNANENEINSDSKWFWVDNVSVYFFFLPQLNWRTSTHIRIFVVSYIYVNFRLFKWADSYHCTAWINERMDLRATHNFNQIISLVESHCNFAWIEFLCNRLTPTVCNYSTTNAIVITYAVIFFFSIKSYIHF